MSEIESSKYATDWALSQQAKIEGSLQYELNELSEQIGPACMLQVALVPPYGEVDNAVKPMPKSDGKARRYATRGQIEDIREHGRKKIKKFL